MGINLKDKRIYFCEVAVHLRTGFQYTKDGKPNNADKLVEKFERNKEFADANYKNYDHIFMFWSPLVKTPPKANSKNNQVKSVYDAVEKLKGTSNN